MKKLREAFTVRFWPGKMSYFTSNVTQTAYLTSNHKIWFLHFFKKDFFYNYHVRFTRVIVDSSTGGWSNAFASHITVQSDFL